MLVKGGFSTYGQTIGVIMFKGTAPRIAGDLGHADTLDVKVEYEIVHDVGFMDLIEANEDAKNALIVAAKRLEKKGVKAITGDCGLLSRYQNELASELEVPFFSSSLLLVPLVWTLQGQKGKIGIVTGHSQYLRREHLSGADIPASIPLVICGMEEEEEFRRVVIEGAPILDTEKMEQGLVNACSHMLTQNPDVRSIILECSNLPTYAHKLSEVFGLPVYDIVSLAKLVSHAVKPARFI